MRLEALYRVEFTTEEAWAVELGGGEGQSFLVVQGQTEGRVNAKLRAANYPRRRTDGVLTPDFRGALDTDDGAVILFAWQGYGLKTEAGERRLVGSITHRTGDSRYAWLNEVIGVVAGEVRARDDGRLDVVLEISELIWEPV